MRRNRYSLEVHGHPSSHSLRLLPLEHADGSVPADLGDAPVRRRKARDHPQRQCCSPGSAQELATRDGANGVDEEAGSSKRSAFSLLRSDSAAALRSP